MSGKEITNISTPKSNYVNCLHARTLVKLISQYTPKCIVVIWLLTP